MPETTLKPTGTEARLCELIAKIQAPAGGDKYGRWTLVEEVFGGKHSKWIARCSCGKEKVVHIENLIRGKSNSCGCFRFECVSSRAKTHGLSKDKTGTYKSWSHMKGRCLNEKDMAYKDYGGRGIKVCDEWMSFDGFLKDMGFRKPYESIERIDVNGDYTPSNCVWIDKRLQARNTRNTRFDEVEVSKIRERLANGEKTSALAKEYGVGVGHIGQIKREEIWRKDL